MVQLNVKLKIMEDRSYPIHIGINNQELLMDVIKKYHGGGLIVLITDKLVAKLYANAIINKLEKSGYSVLLLSVNRGEGSKSSRTKDKLELQMLENKINRHSLVIALGGGVIGDLAGFIAGTYMRGINYIQVPTTLLAMIDSSVGGKTSINTKFGKNTIGVFHQPKAVIMDLNFLDTLPKKMIINGLVEAIKVFLTSDRESFFYVVNNLNKILKLDKEAIKYVIQKAVSLKIHVVEEDEKEQNLRMILNFGHTIGHAIEIVNNYKILHGYSVALGILVEAQISYLCNKLSKPDLDIIFDLFKQLKITSKLLSGVSVDDIIALTLMDKKNTLFEVHCILLKGIGEIAYSGDKVATIITSDLIRKSIQKIL